tara:strand:- start:4695 stop:6263 length:1569 start_codon:yes stop_codon:yes gene_type:complete
VPNFQTSATVRAAQVKRGAQLFRANTDSIPAPTGGWNARDALADMDEKDAVQLTNFFPLTTDVMVRKGYTRWATGFTGQAESLMPYNSPTASTLFAAVGTVFYNVTSQGAVGAAVQTGLTNARWQSTNFANTGGNFLMCVNGVDSMRQWDGSAWSTVSAAITGVATATFVQVNVFKRRVWFVEKDSLKAWYLPVDSITGAAQSIDLRPLASLGGYLVAMGTWTIDSGTGEDDLAVFVTSEGQVIVYRGIDPANDVTWALAGAWNVGSPIGRRCLQKFGGDLLIITFDGIFAMSSLMQSDTVDVHSALSDKIRTAFSDAATDYSANFGWDATVYPAGNMLICNVPISESAGQQQYVMNTINKSWCNFDGWWASCFMLFNDQPYFGADGAVCKAWSGFADNVADVTGTAIQAFNYFGAKGQQKLFTLMRPLINATGRPAVFVNVNVDYDLIPPTTPALFNPGAFPLWDVALWDYGLWGGRYVLKDWQGINGIGYCAAPVMICAANGFEVNWMASDIVFQPGAVL